MPEPTPVLPEVLAQIRALPLSDRPLIICDVDEVILHLILHLESFLDAQDLVFLKHEYRLRGNISRRGSRTPLSPDQVNPLIGRFFDEESSRQTMVPGADEALHALSQDWDIVLLTNLPGHHNKPARVSLLESFGISYPVITNSGPKGGAVASLSTGRHHPVVFIDDAPNNHSSVQASLPSATQIQFIADKRFRDALKPEEHIDLLTGDWQETRNFIGAIL